MREPQLPKTPELPKSNLSPSPNRYVPPERNNFRDEWLSKRHRHWFGYDCPAEDLDCVLSSTDDVMEDTMQMIEYDQCEAVALIEYKHYLANINLKSANIRTLVSLAQKASLPCFVVVYYPEYLNYYVIPLNDLAKAVPHCKEAKSWSEFNFVKMLYWLRRKNCPADVLANLGKNKLPSDAPKPKITGA